MGKVKKLIVSIKFHHDEIELGELVQTNDGNPETNIHIPKRK